MRKQSNHRHRGMLTTPRDYVRILIAIVAFAACSQAQNTTRTILIKKKLTKWRVTPSSSIYWRCTAVERDLYCRLRPNIAVTIVLTPNRWYARSDRSVQFQIRDVPPGKYTIAVWRKSAESFRKSIPVESGHDSVTNPFIPIVDDSGENEPLNTSSGFIVGNR
jgi:hypothetical protein